MKIKIIAIILLVTIISSCNKDTLDVTPGNPVESIYFKSELDYDKLILGVYAKLTEIYNYRAESGMEVGLLALPGDDITTLASSAWTTPYEVFTTLDPNVPTVGEFYKTQYRIISRANIALQKIATADSSVYTTPNLKSYHRGEALFLRGLAYFYLANTFGTSPLILDRIVTPLDAYNTSVPEGTLLDQAILDFTESSKLLPLSWPAYQLGRATSNSANGMLGKCLVFRGSIKNTTNDYSAAITAFDAIKNRTLMADITDNFNALAENNTESLFEFQASSPSGSDNVYVANGDDFQADGVGSTSAYWGNYEPKNSYLYGKPNFLITKKLLATFEKGDPRVVATIDTVNRYLRKYWVKDVKTSNGACSMNNPRILRYADVLLLKAEAVLQSGGNISDALALVNQVRARARNMKVGGTVPADISAGTLTRVQVMDIIRNERYVELAGEESHRWYDLRRWYKGGQIDLSTWNFSSDNAIFKFTPSKNILFPIPQAEIDNNPKSIQNTGY